jgi:hypothetical protein
MMMSTRKNEKKVGSLHTIDECAANGGETIAQQQQQQRRRSSARKRKSDDIVDDEGGPDKQISYPEFTDDDDDDDVNERPVLLNSREAFFDKNSPHSYQTPAAICKSDAGGERIIRSSKSFFDDGDDTSYKVDSDAFSPRKSPPTFQKRPLLTISSIIGGVSPCGVDELFYGCNMLSSWKRPGVYSDEEDDNDNDNDTEDEENDDCIISGHEIKRQDAKDNIREHLSFPKNLGKEFVPQHHDESRQATDSGSSTRRMIRRSPSSRETTLESNSRHKLSSSGKMFRRTDINKVTEIHWDEQVMDNDTLEKMAKLSFTS